jgi:hypothetical protein
MTKWLAAMIVLGFAATATADKPTGSPASAPAQANKAAVAEKKAGEKITGEVIDITCYANHGAMGEKHAACAAKCITAGMPTGILAGGKLYVLTMKDHSSPNAKVGAWAGKQVTATGTPYEKDGTHVFEIDTVEAAAAPAAAPAKK